jgi:uncharacterized protein
MGKKKKAVIRVVLDTNVILSAVLFAGSLSSLHKLWKESKIQPVFSRETFLELQRALHYPKFALSHYEIQMILEQEILPNFAVIEDSVPIGRVCKDPEDDKFLSCAVSASADFLVTGDKDLLAIRKYKTVRIITPSTFLKGGFDLPLPP